MEQQLSDEDKVYIKGLTRRDNRVFGLLFEQYHAQLFRFAQTYVFDTEASEDIVQEVFIKLWEMSEVRIDRSLKAYLFLMVRNRCIDYLRTLHVEDKRKQKLLEAQVLSDSTDIELDEQALEMIKRTINRLPEQCRQVYQLAVCDNMKYADIAAQLDISVSAVKVQLFRARKYLRDNLSKFRDSFLFFSSFIRNPIPQMESTAAEKKHRK